MLTEQILGEHLLLVYNTLLNNLNGILCQGMNAKQVLSLANATLGVIESCSLVVLVVLVVHVMAEGLSLTCCLHRKHAIRRIKRLLRLLGKARNSHGVVRTIKIKTSMNCGYSFFRKCVIYYSLLKKMKQVEAYLLINNRAFYLKQCRLYTSTPRIM